MTTLSNIGSIWDDDNLSGWEKMLQITTNLSMSLPILFNSISSIKKGMIEFKDVTKTIANTWNKFKTD